MLQERGMHAQMCGEGSLLEGRQKECGFYFGSDLLRQHLHSKSCGRDSCSFVVKGVRLCCWNIHLILLNNPFVSSGYIIRDSGGSFKINGYHGGGGVKEKHRLCVLSGFSPDMQEGNYTTITFNFAFQLYQFVLVCTLLFLLRLAPSAVLAKMAYNTYALTKKWLCVCHSFGFSLTMRMSNTYYVCVYIVDCIWSRQC